MTIDMSQFDKDFKALTGHAPLPWQSRLFHTCFLSGALPDAVNIPTGLGKTAVMAIWLIALAWQLRENRSPTLARRLVYVVDRRAVVDQSTSFAEKLRENLAKPEARDLRTALGFEDDQRLPISTLRGQFTDNREWLEDPSLPAIIIGTVDMIGSRLLFEGYGVSPKMRPYHAGLLGADALVLLDEAHLVPSFEALLATIANDAAVYGARDAIDRKRIPTFRLLSLSATQRHSGNAAFALAPEDYADKNDEGAVETYRRLNATKRLVIETVTTENRPSAIAERAWEVSGEGRLGVRCLLYCDKRDDAQKIHDDLRKRLQGNERVELFVGARRVRERRIAQERLEELGFLAGSSANWGAATFLIATSAGEVGVDLDADHMICDLVAWERMVQRFGRVNRRGKGDARIVIVDTGEPAPKKADKPTARENERIRIHRGVEQLLDRLPVLADGRDASPGALREPTGQIGLNASVSDGRDASPGALRELAAAASGDDTLRDLLRVATTPAPLRPALARPLVDAWSMTSLSEHTGRPEIDPWLRGWVEELPQTTVIWRKYLPLRAEPAVGKKEVEDYFEAAPIHASEMLETESYRVIKWLLARANSSSDPRQPDDVLGLLLSVDGKLVRTLRFRDFREESKDDKKRLEAIERESPGKTLVMDARWGGLQQGLLNNDCDDVPVTADDDESLWIAHASPPAIRFRVCLRTHEYDSEDDEPANGDWRENLRFDLERNADGVPKRWLSVQKWRDTSNTENDRAEGRPQALGEHQSWAARRARRIGERLGLTEEYIRVLVLAARLHDEGKQSRRWQRAFMAERDAKKFGIDAPLAKTRGPINQAVLGGYRHEFGSLPHAEKDAEFQQLSADMQDLVLHLIASHHGFARPLIATDGCDDAPPSALAERARNVALRFARLQKRWGPWGLAWWEALLRAADAQASCENDEAGRKPKQEND